LGSTSMSPQRTLVRRIDPRPVVAAVLAALLVATLVVPGVAPAEASGGEGALVAATVEFVGQPADTRVSSAAATFPITTVPFDPGGAPVSVSAGFEVDGARLAGLVTTAQAQLRDRLTQQAQAAGAHLTPKLRRAIDDAVAAANVPTRLPAALDSALGTATVRIAIDRHPPGAESAQLLGTREVALDGGIATFGDLNIRVPGRGYTLAATVQPVAVDLSHVTATVTFTVQGQTRVATATPDGFTATIDPATSDPSSWFTVWNHVRRCTGGPCTLTAPGAGFRTELTAQQSAGTLAINVTSEELCGQLDYRGLPQGVLIDTVDNTGEKVVTFVIDRATVQLVRDDGKSKYDICLVSDSPFTGLHGEAPEVPESEAGGDALRFGPALLPDCGGPGNHIPPCISARTGKQGGDARIVVRLPAGDPWMR
jgi:hypothetical protein